MYPWNHWRTLVPLILGFTGLAALTPSELYHDPLQYLCQLVISTCIFPSFRPWHGSVVSVFPYISLNHPLIPGRSTLYDGPLYFEAYKSLSPTLTSVAIFPVTFTVAPAAIIVGVVTAITGRYRRALWTGWILTTLGAGFLHLQSPDTSTVAWVFLNLVQGLGTGILFAGMGVAVPAAANPKDMAHAVACYSFFRAFGQGFGVAIGGTVFQNAMKRKLNGFEELKEFAAEWSKDAAALVQVLKAMDKGAAKDNLINAYADSLKIVWATMCGLAAVALPSSVFAKGYNLEREMETEQGFDHAETVDDVERSGKYGR